MSTFLLSVLMFAAGGMSCYIIYHIKKQIVNEHTPDKSHKITVRVIAAGSTAAWLVMQVPYSKTTLDVMYYNRHIDLYTPINIALFLIAITCNVIVGGTYFTNIKGNAGS